MTRSEGEPRFPASLRLASLLKAIAWIVSSLAALLLLLTLAGAGVAPIGLAIGIGVACYAVFNHLVLYAAAEGLIIAVAVEQNTRATAILLRQGAAGALPIPQGGAGERMPEAESVHSLGPLGDAIVSPSSESAREREEAMLKQRPEGFLCNRCRFRVLPGHTHCPGCGKLREEIRPVLDAEDDEEEALREDDTEAEEAIAKQRPEGFLCNRCRFRVLPIHDLCPGCGRPRDVIRPVLN